MKRFSVYQIVRNGEAKEAIGLGYVNAKHAPDALARAWKKWPSKMNPEAVQAGFSVRVYTEDHLSLGKLRK